LTDLGIEYSFFLFLSSYDETVSSLVVSSLVTLAGQAPGRAGVPAARGSAFPTAHRVVDRIHGDSPDLWSATTPSRCTCFPKIDILMVGVPNLTHGGPTQDKDLSNLTRRHADLSIAALLGHELG
jgi:hypothetical protein